PGLVVQQGSSLAAVAPRKSQAMPALEASHEAPVVALATGSESLGAGAAAEEEPAKVVNAATSQAPSSQIPQFASGGGVPAGPAMAKSMSSSEIIVVKPSPTPMLHPLSGNSQVRRNKFLASK